MTMNALAVTDHEHRSPSATLRRLRNFSAGLVAVIVIPGGLLLVALVWINRHWRKGDAA